MLFARIGIVSYMEEEVQYVASDVAKEQLLSHTISWLRFPLIVGIVLLHTYIINRPVAGHVVTVDNSPYFALFEHIAKADIGEITVPLFFFISGFLFFYRVDKWNQQVYVRKLKSRFHTLVIPYLLWNTLFLLYVAFLGWIMPSLLTFKKSFLTMTPLEILNTYWELSQGLIPLWFIRDLIIINLLSWILYWMLKPKYGIFVIFILGIIFLSAQWHYLPGVGLRSLFPYMLGAWFSINKCNFVKLISPYRYWLLVLLFILIVVETYLWETGRYSFAVNRACLLCGVLSVPLFVAQGLERNYLQLRKWKEESSFFIYVFHMFIVHLPFVLLARIIPLNDLTAAVLQIAIPILVAYTCAVIYWGLKKMMPTPMRIAVGGR